VTVDGLLRSLRSIGSIGEEDGEGARHALGFPPLHKRALRNLSLPHMEEIGPGVPG